MIAHDDAGDHLYVFDFDATTAGELHSIGLPGAHSPVWSADGHHLAYAVGDALWFHTDGSADLQLAAELDEAAQHPGAFQPTGRTLAVAQRTGILFVSLDAVAEHRTPAPRPPSANAGSAAGVFAYIPPRSTAVPAPFPVPPGRRIADLLWRPDGSALAILLWAPAAPATADLVLLTGTLHTSQRADGITHLLGWRANGDLVATIADAAGEHAVSVHGSAITALRPASEHLFVLAYAAALDRLILASEGEDPSDDATLWLAAPATAAPPVRWLADHPRLADLHLSADATAAVFTERPHGDVYLVAPLTAPARLLLRAAADRTYADPVPRPQPAR